MTLVLRKLLASSTFAIAGALDIHLQPAEGEAHEAGASRSRSKRSWTRTTKRSTRPPRNGPRTSRAEPLSDADRAALEQEIADLDGFAALATSIEHNAKGKALLKALDVAFAKAAELGAAQKAIIFTESRRTQSYLLRLLADSPFADGIVLFNGSNTDDRSKRDLRGVAGAARRAPTASPARAPPTCAPRWWTTSASRAGS